MWRLGRQKHIQHIDIHPGSVRATYIGVGCSSVYA